jgi:hypothetical protein
VQDRQSLSSSDRRLGWAIFAGMIVLAIAIERRVPSLSILQRGEILRNWSRSIGELQHMSSVDPVWFRWAGYMIAVAPFLIWAAIWRSRSRRMSMSEDVPGFAVALLLATYLLTIWQARWGYFFVLLFALALLLLLQPIQSRTAVWLAFALSILPILRDWDERFWPNEVELARRSERRNELAQVRELATTLQSTKVRAFLAPWWLSPAIAYWSGQPSVGGSSHESLPAIADSARFYLSEDRQTAREILRVRRVAWVFAYDADRLAENSSAILGEPIPRNGRSLCFILDQLSVRAPVGLSLAAENGAAKLYRVTDSE